MSLLSYKTNNPQWRDLSVVSHLPEGMNMLSEMAHNLWWSWHSEAINLFAEIDFELWEKVGKNPILLLENVSYEVLESLATDSVFMNKLNAVYQSFKHYLAEEVDKSRPSVAYFSMEYGLDKNLKIYSGGLGILAGDYLKEASDSNVDLCAIGLLYRYGYFNQQLTLDGWQVSDYQAQDFSKLPIEKVLTDDGKQLVIHIPYTDYFVVHANVWKVNVGRISLYLLDTDNDLNSEFDRSITHHLYGGDNENRLKQEILLGIGGILLLKQLGIKKNIYHCNEGHAALLNVQRLVEYINEGLDFNTAMEMVRASSLYTVHTPVPAGHDYFDENLFHKYMEHYLPKLGITWKELVGLGRSNPDDMNEQFCMSVFACKTCQEINAVSLLHEGVSRDMFAPIWKGYFSEELLNIGHVTNGVHLSTWCASEWKQLYLKYFDSSFTSNQSDPQLWQKIYQVSDEELWEIHQGLKHKLLVFLKQKCIDDWLRCQINPELALSIAERFNPNALIIGFGRRFATYKRAYLLFSDEKRLSQIVNNPDRPVIFIFTEKAHPADDEGKQLIKRIVGISHQPEFMGKIIFLENYDMELARRLVSGVDVWLNTPTRLAEASGTSGEKALMNGVLNFSVLDGWWYEGYREKAGWALPAKAAYQNTQYQDQLDASAIYYLLEQEIIPLYYQHESDKNYSPEWVQYMKNSIAQIAPHYTMKRQLDEYYSLFYTKLFSRYSLLAKDHYAQAKLLCEWKKQVISKWDSVEVSSIRLCEDLSTNIMVGKSYEVIIDINEQGLDDAVGVECVIKGHKEGKECLYSTIPLNLIKREGSLFTFMGKIILHNSGNFKIAFRMYPKHTLLPHRQDFCYTKWF